MEIHVPNDLFLPCLSVQVIKIIIITNDHDQEMLLANFPYQLTPLNPSLTKNNEIDFFVENSSPFFFFEISIIFLWR